MMIVLGVALLALSILLLRYAKAHADSDSRFWTYAARSDWLPILFTGMFGFGVAATIGGVAHFVAP